MRVLREGARLADRYTLVRRLGVGGISEVWLAFDGHADARVALKFLTAEAATDTARTEYLRREWQTGTRLMHANIIRVFEFFDEADGAYFGMQYVGETDIGVLAGADPADSMRPVGLIADALRYAHGKGLVHRDIKAANILLDSRGIPYLADFGVAAAAGSDSMGVSGSGIAMSPEQASGGAARPADDIYALGVLMHELLAGVPPGGPANRDVSATLADGSPMPRPLFALVTDMLAAASSARPDALTVAARLAGAGFAPGPAPSRFVAGAEAAEAVFETVETATSLHKRMAGIAPAVTGKSESSGISPRILYGALGTALVLFLVVVLILPKLVPGDRGMPGERPAASVPASSGNASGGNDTRDTTGEPVSDAADDPRIRTEADDALGKLLSQLERLRLRAIERWGGQAYIDAVKVYGEGDAAYVQRDYRLARDKYRQASDMLAPFFDRIESEFDKTLAAAKEAFAAADTAEAVRLFDLAAAITPGNREAEAGLARARHLAAVLLLMDQGASYEADVELDLAKLAYEKALQQDAQWEPASLALARVKNAIRDLSFQQRMTEGLEALGAGDFSTARAAFNAAKDLDPASREPADGLLQVDQAIRLASIRRLAGEAKAHDSAEEWEMSVAVYEEILGIDATLQFAQDGLVRARSRTALHKRLQAYIDSPDTLSEGANMQGATRLLLQAARIQPAGARLEEQKTALSRLLKRAATPLTVALVSDNQTDVSVFKVGRFGNFTRRELELRPGNYVAVGIRPGFRDVRVEFRVAPEIDMQPVVVQCEEPI